MGLDVRSKVIVGVKLDLVVDKVTKTKYNEDTGQPYQIIEEIPMFYVDGKAVSRREEIVDDFDDVLHYSDYEDTDSYFLGMVIAKTGTGSHNDSELYSEITNTARVSKTQKFTTWLKDHELEIDPSLIKEYLIMHLSY